MERISPALANLWHACPKWHARRFCVARVILLRCIKFVLISAVFELPGGWGVEPPYFILPPPLPLVKIRPRGGRVSTPHLSFVEVGMLFPSHFLLMQFLKYLQCDDLNVTTILIHIED